MALPIVILVFVLIVAFAFGICLRRAVPQLRKLKRTDRSVCPGWWYVREEAGTRSSGSMDAQGRIANPYACGPSTKPSPRFHRKRPVSQGRVELNEIMDYCSRLEIQQPKGDVDNP